MVNIKSLFLFATTALAAATPRHAIASRASDGFDLILSDLQDLDASVNALTTTLNTYQGGSLATAPIFAAFADVNTTNRKAYADAQTIPVQNSTNSLIIANYVQGPLASNISTTIQALDAKKTILVAAGFQQQIINDLTLVADEHDSLSLELAGKLNLLGVLDAALPVVGIDLDIRSAILDFST